MIVDTTKKFIFIWVPGTMGHDVHPAFKRAVKDLVGDESQLIHVEYPALWDFDNSVPQGETALKAMLKQVAAEKLPEQKVFVGGSSQGAWVIGNVYGNTPYTQTFTAGQDEFNYAEVANKTVLFGHPGVAKEHDHTFHVEDKLWEINDAKNDAVTFGWRGENRKIVRAVVDLQHGKWWKAFYLLGKVVTHPVKAFKLLWLIACYVGLIKWATSPHDYSHQMPLAVYWLVN